MSPAPLTSSRSVDFGEERHVRSGGGGGQHDNINLGARTGLTITVRGSRMLSDSFSSLNDNSEHLDLARLGSFSQDIEATMKQAMDDPNR